MLEHGGESVSALARTQRITLPLSESARASLLAVRAAQEAARARARRQTVRTRAWLGGIVGGLAVGVLVFGPRLGREAPPPVAAGRTANGASAAVSAPRVPGPTPGAAATETTATTATTTPSAAAAATPATASADGAAVAATSAGAPSTSGNAAANDEESCAASFGQRRWRLSIEACTKAFEANSTDAGLALRIAHAHHARARLPEAGEWANRAIALDPSLAEAFVIRAHAEARAGRTDAAVDAYRRYLGLAPRGWHAGEARAALRAHRREEHAGMPGGPDPA